MPHFLRPLRRIGFPVVTAATVLVGSRPAAAVEQLDWCAPVVVRPDQHYWSYAPCEPWWKPETISQRANFIFDGFTVPSPQVLTPDASACFGANSHANTKAYHDDLRARAASHGRSLVFVWYQRFDVVERQMAAAPGFDANFLVPSATTWHHSMDFFTKDLTETCVCGCAWSPERGPSATPPGTLLKDYVDASGGPGTYETKVQYAIRPATGGTADGTPRKFYGSAAITDLRNPAYRAWILAQTQAGLVAGGFDVVELNQKFHQYLPSNPTYAWGGPLASDVARYMNANDTLWSAMPAGDGYPEYVQGWAAMGADLTAAAVPYTVTLTPFQWPPYTLYNDPSSPADERAMIRDVARGARYVFLERGSGVTPAQFDAVKTDIETGSGATVVSVDSNCGYGGPDDPQNPLPGLAGQVSVLPDAGVVSKFKASSITMRPFGTATSAWDAELWCNCLTPPCGTPDATLVGQTGSSASVPASTCDAGWRGATGAYWPRTRITRAGSSVQSIDRVTICLPACSNGVDDDDDGLVDYPADPGCATSDSTFESTQCNNDKDDDGDGLTDLADPACIASWYRFENPPASGCGLLGGEALLVLGVVAAARRVGWR